MIKNIWNKIKLAFDRKPAGEIQQTYESYGGDKFTEGTYKIEPPIKITTKEKR